MTHKTLLLTAAALTMTSFAAPAQAEPNIEVVAEMQKRPGNPAVTPDGTIYVTMHPFDKPEYKVLRLDDGKAIPYPNAEISKSFAAVIGIQATKAGDLWWLDMGSKDVSPKLVGWNTKANKLKATHVIPREASVANSFHQDFAIDEKRGKAYIADMSRGGMIDESNPAIVVVDLNTGETRRVLSSNKVFQPAETPIMVEGKPMRLTDDEGKIHDVKLGLNPITISPDNEWLYFASMTAGNLYRVPSAILGDLTQPESAIEAAIEVYGKKPYSDGMAAAKGGVVYVTNVNDNAISEVSSEGTKIWAKDARFVWADGLYVAPDNSVVVTVNQLNRAPAFNGGKSSAVKPFKVMRITNN